MFILNYKSWFIPLKYTCLIKLSDHKRLTYQFRALISQVAEIAKTCHIFITWSFTYTSLDFKYWKKKILSATILTLKPMCRLCTLYSPTKRILQMKSKLNLKSGKPVMWTSVWLHFLYTNFRSWWMLKGTLVHHTNTVVKSAKFVNHSWIMGAHQKLRLKQSTGVPIRVWQGIFFKKELRYKRAQFSDFSTLVLSNYFIR